MRRALAVTGALVLLAVLAGATTYDVYAGATQSAILAALAQLRPGDTLRINPGTYNNVDLVLSGVVGTSAAWITIQGVSDVNGVKPLLIANTDAYQENVYVTTGCAYVKIDGFHFQHAPPNPGQTQSSIFFDSDVHDITISNNEISQILGHGINLQMQNNIHHVLIQNNHIHNTGLLTSDTACGCQAFTSGSFRHGQPATGVHDLYLIGNLIHDVFGQEGDCAKFMYGVYSSTMADNVMYNCPRAAVRGERYGIASYPGGGTYANGGPAWASPSTVNTIVRNLVLNSAQPSPANNVAIYLGAGCVAENNIVINANSGIGVDLEDAPYFMNTRVCHNTVYGIDKSWAMRIGNTVGALPTFVVANNLLSVGGTTTTFGYRFPTGPDVGTGIVKNNYYDGQDYTELPASSMTKLSAFLSTAVVANPTMTVPGANFMPTTGSVLIGAGYVLSTPTTDDFDTNPRKSPPCVGAYEAGSSGTVPHWPISLNFKGSTGVIPPPATPPPTTPAPTPTNAAAASTTNAASTAAAATNAASTSVVATSTASASVVATSTASTSAAVTTAASTTAATTTAASTVVVTSTAFAAGGVTGTTTAASTTSTVAVTTSTVSVTTSTFAVTTADVTMAATSASSTAAVVASTTAVTSTAAVNVAATSAASTAAVVASTTAVTSTAALGGPTATTTAASSTTAAATTAALAAGQAQTSGTSKRGSGLSTGALVGIIVGALLFLVLLAIVGVVVYKFFVGSGIDPKDPYKRDPYNINI